MINEVFLLITAVVFTFVGMWMRKNNESDNTTLIIESTIDRLIDDGYIKTSRDENGEIELIKYYE
jgi:Na+/H+ antiporter NhaC